MQNSSCILFNKVFKNIVFWKILVHLEKELFVVIVVEFVFLKQSYV